MLTVLPTWPGPGRFSDSLQALQGGDACDGRGEVVIAARSMYVYPEGEVYRLPGRR